MYEDHRIQFIIYYVISLQKFMLMSELLVLRSADVIHSSTSSLLQYGQEDVRAQHPLLDYKLQLEVACMDAES